MKFSLCIPTMNRYDIFLSKHLPLYIENQLISEIIITYENGEDIKKINNSNIDKTKLKLYTNEKRLGPFMNKLRACSYSTNEWIALIDSDNFADNKYFDVANNYINNNKLFKTTILMPSKGNLNKLMNHSLNSLDYTYLNGKVFKKGNFGELREFERLNKGNKTDINGLMNTGNYIINKYLLDNISLKDENEIIEKSSARDVIYLNTLLFEQFNLEMHIVKDIEYIHTLHTGSIAIETDRLFPQINNYILNRFMNLR